MNTEIIDFYLEGNSRKKTCNKFNITDTKLKNILKENNIHIRNHSEQLILENIKRTKGVNHFYFDELNNKNVYYLGFFGADATVRKNRNEIKIALSLIDKDFLEQLKKDIDIEKEIKIRNTTNGFQCAELSFSSAKIKQQLMKYKIVPNKTYIGLSLDVIPDEFKLAFIKGFFDGDGSFSFNKNTKQCKLAFTSHTKKILEEIKKYFNNGYIYQDKRTKVFSLEFSTQPSLNIMKSFYNLDTAYLNRKKEKYLEYLDLRNKNPRDKSPS